MLVILIYKKDLNMMYTCALPMVSGWTLSLNVRLFF